MVGKGDRLRLKGYELDRSPRVGMNAETLQMLSELADVSTAVVTRALSGSNMVL